MPTSRRPFLILVGMTALSWCFFGWIPGRNVILGADTLGLVSPWLRSGATAHDLTLTDPLWQFYPWLREFRRAVVGGRFPLWDVSIRAGVPIAANPQSAYFFPLSWLVIPLGTNAGVSAIAVLRPALAAFFAYLYFRRGRHSISAALLGAITYGFSLPFIVWAEHPQDNVLLMLPLLLMQIDDAIRRPVLFRLGRVALALALTAVAGHPESALHVFVFALVYSAVQARRLFPRPVVRSSLRLAAAGVWGVALCLFIVYPQILVVVESVAFRQQGPRTILIPPAVFRSAVWPRCFADSAYSHNETAFFYGILPLVLAAAAFFRPARRSRLPPPTFWAASALVMIGFIFVAPRSAAFLSIPFLGKTYQNRLTIPLGFALGAIAARGLDSARRSAPARRCCWASLVGLALAASVIVAPLNLYRPGRFQLIGEGAAFAVIATSLLLLRREAAAGAVLLCAGQCLDLWRAGSGYHARVRPEQVFPAVPILQALRAEAGDGRILGVGLVLPPNSATVYGLRDVRGSDAVESGRFRSARLGLAAWDPSIGHPEMTATGFTPRSRGLLMLFSVRALLLPGNLRPAANLRDRYGFDLLPVWQGDEGRIYRVEGIPGRFQAIAHVSPPSGLDSVVADPGRGSAVETIDHPLFFPQASRASIVVAKDEPEQVVLRVVCPGAFFLRISDAWDRGWHASLDGKPLRLYRADSTFRGSMIPAGSHRLEMRYRLPGSPLTSAVSALAGALLLAAIIVKERRRPQREENIYGK